MNKQLLIGIAIGFWVLPRVVSLVVRTINVQSVGTDAKNGIDKLGVILGF